jgi:Zn-dependent M28 family amino/carboxypeptidase
VAVIAVADPTFDAYFPLIATNALRGSYAIEDGSEPRIATNPPVFLLRPAAEALVSAPGARLNARLAVDRFEYPSVNVVARVRGTDPARTGQYVLFSAHQDHDGVRAAIAGDSSYSGADDNATVSVALLAIARAFAEHPGRRSALFVWHGAEEKGLFGSRWHVEHPLVPRDSIVAALNGDMIGRNHPDTAALLGSIPPHRNSTDLVAMAHEANRRVSTFVIDSTWDRPTHREGWYFRSDHLPYARANIPALFFTTLLHEDYHTPFDNPDRIDIAKLGRMTKWMYATGWLAANAPDRPRIDPGFQLER